METYIEEEVEKELNPSKKRKIEFANSKTPMYISSSDEEEVAEELGRLLQVNNSGISTSEEKNQAFNYSINNSGLLAKKSSNQMMDDLNDASEIRVSSEQRETANQNESTNQNDNNDKDFVLIESNDDGVMGFKFNNTEIKDEEETTLIKNEAEFNFINDSLITIDYSSEDSEENEEERGGSEEDSESEEESEKDISSDITQIENESIHSLSSNYKDVIIIESSEDDIASMTEDDQVKREANSDDESNKNNNLVFNDLIKQENFIHENRTVKQERLNDEDIANQSKSNEILIKVEDIKNKNGIVKQEVVEETLVEMEQVPIKQEGREIQLQNGNDKESENENESESESESENVNVKQESVEESFIETEQAITKQEMETQLQIDYNNIKSENKFGIKTENIKQGSRRNKRDLIKEKDTKMESQDKHSSDSKSSYELFKSEDELEI
ncbi:hypothetical protein K502DRAFT_168307 [Neoconidiobolus thromboides FSU 785]|nr:hypothetical protein K502DRAFT_168307 [Neoconidiobolus thromboides FSU 785]